MENKRQYLVKVTKEILVTFDKDKYCGEALNQFIECNEYDPNDGIELIIEDAADLLALEHVSNGYTDDREGFIKDGHKTEHLNTYTDVKKIL